MSGRLMCLIGPSEATQTYFTFECDLSYTPALNVMPRTRSPRKIAPAFGFWVGYMFRLARYLASDSLYNCKWRIRFASRYFDFHKDPQNVWQSASFDLRATTFDFAPNHQGTVFTPNSVTFDSHSPLGLYKFKACDLGWMPATKEKTKWYITL